MKYNLNIIQIYEMLYRNISPFCEPLSFDLPYEFFAVFIRIFFAYFLRIFYYIFVRIFSSLCNK